MKSGGSMVTSGTRPCMKKIDCGAKHASINHPPSKKPVMLPEKRSIQHVD